jgi:hypothetical protein
MKAKDFIEHGGVNPSPNKEGDVTASNLIDPIVAAEMDEFNAN